MNNYCTFYIVRHALSEANKAGVRAGQIDSDISPEGVKEAKKRAQELKNVPFDKGFSSDLLRAKETAEIIASEHDIPVETTKVLRERSWGSWEGKPYINNTEEIKRRQVGLSQEAKMNLKFTDDMESEEEAATRLKSYLMELAKTYPGKTLLIVSHGNIIRRFW